ncbi:TOMM precursor leader peptide-binding protein [Peribacillus sp. NPDC097206]|uniref:TOMM precursor leader peptide-binding protein n=1 Tax=Peribacillus sp. NPDC097206 TaxID=3364398 RepID=UPI0037F88467
MKPVILMVGEGVLADLVYGILSVQYEIIHQVDFLTEIPETAELALVLQDAWDPSAHLKAEEVLDIPWLRGFVSFGEGMVGPLVRMEKEGCSQCADLRHLMAGRDRKEMWAIQKQLQENGGKQDDPAASRTGLLQMAYLIGEEVQRVTEGTGARSEYAVALINMKTLNISWHPFLADPICPVCSPIPDDSSRAARISLQPSPKVDPDGYRTRSMTELSQVLAKDYLDPRMGFLNNKMVDLVPPFADVSVSLPLFMGDEGTAGRTNSYAVSEMTAILEGLERYCGLEPRGKRTVVHDSYNNLKDEALDPRKLGVHTDEMYEMPGFPFKRFHPDSPINWVWSYSFLQERPVLVPELVAYYSLGCGEGFVYETSNGCALGGSLEEAILYGIFEVVERDSFLLTWYAKLPLSRLDPYSANDEELALMMDRARAAAGYDIHLYNATMEHGIPSVWAMAKNRKGKGLNLICAGGAHLDPIRAAKSAIHELAGMMLTLDDKFEANQEEYEKMLADPYLVQQMDDHGMLFGLRQAEERLHFLLDDRRPLHTFDEEFLAGVKHADLMDDLQDVLLQLQQHGLDVLVVDQTTPELKKNGLHCVKVLIPGMLPMTFGHHLTRVTGLDRVLQVPVELGYAKQPLTIEQLNQDPHPFP